MNEQRSKPMSRKLESASAESLAEIERMGKEIQRHKRGIKFWRFLGVLVIISSLIRLLVIL